MTTFLVFVWLASVAYLAVLYLVETKVGGGIKGRSGAIPVPSERQQGANDATALPSSCWFPGWSPEEEAEARTLNDLYDRTNVRGEYELFPYKRTGRHSPTVDLRRFDTADCIVLAEAYTNWRLGSLDDEPYGDADFCDMCGKIHGPEEPCAEPSITEDGPQERTGEDTDD